MHKLHNLCIINPFSDYVDSDDEEAPIEHFDDDGGPPQDLDDAAMLALQPSKTRVLALESLDL